MSKQVALHWRLIPHRYNLIGTECTKCGGKFFPPRKICPTCRRKGSIQDFKFSGGGEIYSYTTIHAASDIFHYQTPYVLAIIKLDEGPMVTAQIVDCEPEDLKMGVRVYSVFRKIFGGGSEHIIRYGYKFKVEKKKKE